MRTPAAQAMLLVLVVRGYDALSSRMRRMPLVVTVSGTLAATILAFAALAAAGVRIGIPFYLFVGIFSLTILAQFWALANDVYSEEQGKRIFAILGIGSSTGAVVGAKLASTLFVSLRAAVMAALGVLGLVHRRERIEHRVTESRTPARGVSAWRLVFAQRYLLLIAVMTVLLDWINSTGEHLLERTLLEQAAVEKAAGGIVDIEAYIAEFKGSYFGWFNFVGYLLQLFVASRALRYLGVRGTLFILPALSLTGYTLMAIAPVLAAIRVAKIAENSVDYSRESTARQALYSWPIATRSTTRRR
jgi:ATP:ADP antiporter, AAA family